MGLEKLALFAENAWNVTLALAFWLLVGLLVAGLLHVFVPNDFIERHLGRKRGVLGVLNAVFLGVPMPLCSCGVIPAALGIKKQGAGDGAAMGFLISTPQTGIDSIMVSASMLGFPFALFKLASAFVLGVVGGIWAGLVGRKSENTKPSPAPLPSGEGEAPETGAEGARRPLGLVRAFREIFEFAVDDLLAMIWKWLVAGILVSAAISTWLPEGFFKDHLAGGGAITAMLITLAISLPMYVCATASVPIAAALVYSGMPPGAALVFLMAGPASNIATLGAVYKTFGLKKLMIYLSTITIGSMLGGYFFDSVVAPGTALTALETLGTPGWWQIAAAVLLALLIARFAAREGTALLKRLAGAATSSKEAETLTIKVSGLTCEGCAAKLRRELENIDGVNRAEVVFSTGDATITGYDLDAGKLRMAVEKAGYKAK